MSSHRGPAAADLKILKFGGSSVRDAAAIRQVVAVIAGAGGAARGVVVSAMGGVTDGLLAAARRAESRHDDYRDALAALRARHLEAAGALAAGGDRAPLLAALETAFEDLGDLLHGTYLLREASARTLDAVAGYGERLSSQIVAAALRAAGVPAAAVDARRLIVTDGRFGAAQVDLAETERQVRAHFAAADRGQVQVVPGFIGATPEGQATTLGRGGSDYTAALLAAALGADALELWTDVDAVMTADPGIVPDAQPIARLSYVELLELCHFGAKVVYPPAIHPSRAKGIPVLIRNTFRPQAPFTTVTAEVDLEAPSVRGISAIREVALLRLEGDGMVGVPGIAGRLFGALSQREVSVILISQASSEHSICFAVAPDAVERAARAIDDAFSLERQLGLVEAAVVERRLAVIAVVGAGMRERPGIAGAVFGALGARGISVRAIAQGSSELNISLVVATGDRDDAVRALHRTFVGGRDDATARADSKGVVTAAIAGVGGVGTALLGQLATRREGEAPRLRLVAVGSSRGWLADPGGLDPAAAGDRLRNAADLADLDAMLEAAAPDVFVDVTASAAVAAAYDRVLASAAAVVTANKLRLAGSTEQAAIAFRQPQRCFFETTVGAGLPVVGTLHDLVASGDRVVRIEGTLSGTLGFLASEMAAGRPLSAALRDAFERGYTEPDPREDLGGRDAARKLLILARLAGRSLEPADIAVAPILPRALDELPLAAFWSQLPQLDAPLAARSAAAAKRGHTLAFLAVLDAAGARLGLEEVPADHPCATARGTDNVIVITTERYCDSPLVIRGPGAGTAVTAAGVLADLLRAAARIHPGDLRS